jgi:hypothetical protein
MDESKMIALNWRIREIDRLLETLRKAIDYEEEQLEKHKNEVRYMLVERDFIEESIQHLRSQP